MDRLYVLAPDIKYRREWFGGIVYAHRSKATRFFNHAAAFAIEQFGKPASFAAVQRRLNQVLREPQDHSAFLTTLEDAQLITPVTGDEASWGRCFFTDVRDFITDRLHAPLGVELELTLKCMRRCLYCAYDSSRDAVTEGQLDRAHYKQLFDQLDQAGVCYLRFTGGDPLTRADCLDIVGDADERDFALAVASDLTVLQAEHARRLGSLRNLTALQTTLDGPTPEIADALRGAGNFRRVMRGIPLLREHGVPLIVGTVLTKRNVGNIYQIAQVLAPWDVAYCVSPLYDAGRGRALRELIPDDEDLAYAYEQFAAAVRDGLVRPADPGWEAIAEGMTVDARRALWRGQPWLVRSPDRLLRMDPFGRCYTSIHLKEVFGDDVYIGKVPEQDVLTLWNESPLLNKLRRARQKNQYYGDVIDIRHINMTTEVHHG